MYLQKAVGLYLEFLQGGEALCTRPALCPLVGIYKLEVVCPVVYKPLVDSSGWTQTMGGKKTYRT